MNSIVIDLMKEEYAVKCGKFLEKRVGLRFIKESEPFRTRPFRFRFSQRQAIK